MAGLELWELAYLAGVVWVGAFVRGFTGFGSSMIYVVGLTFAMPASTAVPIILLLEIAATVHLLPPVWRLVDWRSLALLLTGCVAATPVGLALLSYLPRAPMQAVIACVVLVTCLALRSGFRFTKQPGVAGTLGVGLVSGVLTGATSAGGPPVVIYYFSSPVTVAAARASIIAFLGAADLMAAGMAAYDDLIGEETFVRAAMALPPMFLGAWMGIRTFKRADPDRFRGWVIVVLAALSIASLAKALFAMAS